MTRASEEGVTDVIVCEELGISARQRRRWCDECRLLGDDALPGQGRHRDEELTTLKRELAKVTQERGFKRCGGVRRQGVAMRDRCIDRRRHHYPVGMRGPLCKVSSSGDSAWRVRPERPSAKTDREITRVMRRRHAERQGG
ncbi:MAG: hypothetical protein E2O38_11930 [Proteobacteria bacterium]|nr:MAG: hypothetical protein E2O38_11930 [Pseudomonadota bacterium]